MEYFLIILAIIIIGLFFWMISIYNTLIGLIEAANNDQKQIDIQLDRRYKVFESLIAAVNKYMDHEKTTLQGVTALRSQAVQAMSNGDIKGRIAAENAISKIATGLNINFEQYPELQADKNIMQLQETIINTENKLSYAKQAFNDAIERYNALKKSFFQSIVVSVFSAKLDKQFQYWGLPEQDIKSKEEYTVKF